MPTYEYRCDTCDRKFDVVQSFQDDPLTACPTCGPPIRKVFGNVGIVFKGSGFYKTDSRGTTRAGVEKSDSATQKGDSSDGKAAPSGGDSGGSGTVGTSDGKGSGKSEGSETSSSSDSAPPAGGKQKASTTSTN